MSEQIPYGPYVPSRYTPSSYDPATGAYTPSSYQEERVPVWLALWALVADAVREAHEKGIGMESVAAAVHAGAEKESGKTRLMMVAVADIILLLHATCGRGCERSQVAPDAPA